MFYDKKSYSILPINHPDAFVSWHRYVCLLWPVILCELTPWLLLAPWLFYNFRQTFNTAMIFQKKNTMTIDSTVTFWEISQGLLFPPWLFSENHHDYYSTSFLELPKIIQVYTLMVANSCLDFWPGWYRHYICSTTHWLFQNHFAKVTLFVNQG